MRLALPLFAFLVLAAPAFGQQRANDRLIEEAVAALGVRPDAPAMRWAVNAAFAELLPGESYRRYRVNRTQARAIAYVAVLFAADGGFAPEPQPLPDPPPPVPACYDAVQAVYELAAAVPPNDYGLFVTDEEKAAVRSLATDVRRLASACGCLALADAALEAVGLVEPLNADREALVNHLERMRGMAGRCS